MDLDLKHLQKVEAGQLNVTLVTLVRIADGLEVPMSDLFPRRRSTRA
jgi:transcriptional regulator with XRE-family HTH domain